MTGRKKFLCGWLLTTSLACQHVAPSPLSPEDSANRLADRSLADPGLRLFVQNLQDNRDEAVTPWPPTRWGLEELTLAGLYFQPDLRAASAGLGIAEARTKSAGQLQNPTLVVFPQRVSSASAGVSPWLAAVQIDWTIETAGKRGHRQAAAQARADAAWLAIPSVAWTLRGRISEAIVRAEGAAARLAAARRSLAIQSQLVELLEGRLRAGATDQSGVLPQHIALIGMRAEVARFERLALESRAALAAELALPAEALEDVEVDYPLDREPVGLEDLDTHEARRAAMLGRSDILALLAEYVASEADLRLELARQVPDLRFGPGYEFDQGTDKWGLALSLDLPLLNQNQGGIAEAVALRREAAIRFEALQTRILTELDSGMASLHGAQVELEQARLLVEAVGERRQRVATAFDAGAADRVALLGADLERQQALSVLINAQEQWHLAAAQLERAVQPDRAFARSVVANWVPEVPEKEPQDDKEEAP